MIVRGALQEALQWMDLPSALGGEGALVSVTPMFVDTGVGLLIGPLLGHTVMVTVTDIRDTGDHLGVTGVHLEEERLPDTEAEEAEAAVSPVVLCVTVLAVIVKAPYKVVLLWTDIAGHHQLKGVNHHLGAEAGQNPSHLGALDHQSKPAEVSQYHPRRVPLERQVWFPMEMDLLIRDREYMLLSSALDIRIRVLAILRLWLGHMDSLFLYSGVWTTCWIFIT